MHRLAPWSCLLTLLVPAVLFGQGVPLELKPSSTVLALAWSADNKRLALGSADGGIRIVALPGGKEISRSSTTAPVSGLVFSPDGKWLGVKEGDPEGPLCIWDVANGRKLKDLWYKGYSCNQLAFTANGQTLVAAGAGNYMVWHHSNGSGYGSNAGRQAQGAAAAAAGDGSIVAWSTPQGQVQLHHVQPRRYERLQLSPLSALAFSADARWLAYAGLDKTIHLRELAGGERRQFAGLREPAKLLQFSANGKVLAAAAAGDPVVRLWDVATGRLRRRITTAAEVRALALAGDGLSLAISNGAQVCVWNVATRELGDLGPATPLAAAELTAAWQDLASSDTGKAETAFGQLARAQHHAIAFLHGQVRAIAVPPVDRARLQRLIDELDHPTYQVRERAFVALAEQGEIAVPAVERYLSGQPSLEGKRRAHKLLEGQREPPMTADRLRCLEAIELLEILKTAEARRVLEELSREALLTQLRLAAREALERWQQPEAAP
jgi:hypothetical protein